MLQIKKLEIEKGEKFNLGSLCLVVDDFSSKDNSCTFVTVNVDQDICIILFLDEVMALIEAGHMTRVEEKAKEEPETCEKCGSKECAEMRAEIRRDIDEFNANAKNRTKEEKDKKGMAILKKMADAGNKTAKELLFMKMLEII